MIRITPKLQCAQYTAETFYQLHHKRTPSMTFPFHLKIDLSQSFIFYSGCLTFLFYPPTLSFPVSVTPLSYSLILSSLTTKNPLNRPKLTTLSYSCAISPALYHVYHRIRIMILPRPVAKGVKVYKSLSAPTT